MTVAEGMTQQQIDNWRKVLVGTLGPSALLMPDEEVQALRDKWQVHFDEYAVLDEQKEEK